VHLHERRLHAADRPPAGDRQADPRGIARSRRPGLLRVARRRLPDRPVDRRGGRAAHHAKRAGRAAAGDFRRLLLRCDPRSRRRQRLLLDELNHRVKNTLATVQSIASQTLRSARDLASGRADFEARILALSNAHNLLSAQEWASAELAEVIAGTFSAFDPARLDIDGPRVTLAPKASISLALVMHELCTNASKYGALSCERGTVRIRWWIEDGGSGPLMIEWTERGGPPTRQPERRGFGSRMIGGVVTGELGGAFDAAYDREGFSCRIKVPEDALVQD